MMAGDLVYRWHDTVAFGMKLVYGHVVRVNRKTVTVKWESGHTSRIEPQNVYPESAVGKADIEREIFEKQEASA